MFGYVFLACLVGFVAAGWGLVRPYLNIERKWFFVLGALFFVGMPAAGSYGQAAYEASPEGQRRRAQQEADADRAATIDLAKSLVKAWLRDPGSAEFSGLRVVTVDGKQAVCGLVNSRNGFGGMSGPTPFVDLPDEVITGVSIGGTSHRSDKQIEHYCG
jgi:hypothetical protein